MYIEQEDGASTSQKNQPVEETQVTPTQEGKGEAIRIYRKELEKRGFSPT